MITAENILQETRLWPQFEQLKLAVRLFEQAQPIIVPIEEDRDTTFRRVRGMLKGLPGAEEFRREKKRELELEEKRYAERFGNRAEAEK
jgi:hypothetical protein